MAIHALRQPPESGPATIIRALGDLAPPESRLGGGRLDISLPFTLYRLGLDDIDNTFNLDRAEFVGWRYILDGGGHRTGTADVAQPEAGQPRFAGLARNEQADFLLQAAHLAERVAESLSDDCEAHILVVPALYVSAVWLTAIPPIFIPFLDASHPIRGVDDVTVRPDFMTNIVERARLARDRRPELPSTSLSP